MNIPTASTINSDLTTPLDVTIGKKSDAAGTTSSSSLFSWVKAIFNSITALTGTTNGIDNSMGVKTLVCPVATTSSSQPANVNVSSLPPLAQIVGFNVESTTGLVGNVGSVTINGVRIDSPGAPKASDMPGVRETNSASITPVQNSGSFILTIYYRL